MNYTRIIVLLIVLVLGYYIFLCGCKKILPDLSIPLKPMQIVPEIQKEIEDLAEHNKLVLNQINDYIEKQKIPNYTQESIPNGTLKLYDIKDTY